MRRHVNGLADKIVSGGWISGELSVWNAHKSNKSPGSWSPRALCTCASQRLSYNYVQETGVCTAEMLLVFRRKRKKH